MLTKDTPKCPKCGHLDAYRTWTTAEEITYICSSCSTVFKLSTKEKKDPDAYGE